MGCSLWSRRIYDCPGVNRFARSLARGHDLSHGTRLRDYPVNHARNSTGSGAWRFALVLCVLGLAFTVLVWITLRSLKARSDFLTKHLAITDTLYEAYLSKSGLYSTTILTDVLPGAAGLAWIALIAEMLYFQ
jgi:hypothetical protein